jgi:hypothetical protein
MKNTNNYVYNPSEISKTPTTMYIILVKYEKHQQLHLYIYNPGEK